MEDVSSRFTGTETRFSINANHMDMSKFSSKEDDGYRKVSRELKFLCEGSRQSVTEQNNLKQKKRQYHSIHSSVHSHVNRCIVDSVPPGLNP